MADWVTRSIHNDYVSISFPEDEVDVVRPLEDIVVKSMGHQVTFECELSRDVHEFAWLKNGKTVVPSKHIKLMQSDGIYKLHIDQVEPEDAAEYTLSCRGKKTTAKLIPRSTFLVFLWTDYLVSLSLPSLLGKHFFYLWVRADVLCHI